MARLGLCASHSSLAMAVAAALAFGLGSRELAVRVTRDWYARKGPRYRRYDPTTDEADEDERRPAPLAARRQRGSAAI
jgi:hypothetical protein